MAGDAEYTVDYERRPVGSAETGDYDPATDRELVRTIPNAPGNRECDQAAVSLVERLADQCYSGSVMLDRLGTGQSSVDDLDIEGLSMDRTVPRDIRHTRMLNWCWAPTAPRGLFDDVQQRHSVREKLA